MGQSIKKSRRRAWCGMTAPGGKPHGPFQSTQHSGAIEGLIKVPFNIIKWYPCIGPLRDNIAHCTHILHSAYGTKLRKENTFELK